MENLLKESNYMNKFDFTKQEFENIVDKCMFNEELSKILEYRIKNYSIIQISMIMNMSDSTIKRRIKEIKRKIMRVI